MIKYLILTLFILSAGHADLTAQTSRRPASSVYTGLGAYSIQQADVFSFGSNQASLARIKNVTAGMYGEKRFMLDELGFYKLSIAIPTSSGNFGMVADYFGFSDYNENRAGLAYARKLGERIDIGVQFNYHSISIAGYGNASAVNAEIGALVHFSEKLHAGIHVFNPAGGKFNKGDDEKLVSVYSFGLGYDASDIFFISAEIEKEENQPVNVNAGLQYKFLSSLAARAGISTAESAFYLGFGLLLKSLRLDVVSSYHQQLGITPGLLLQYNFPRRENRNE